MTGALVAGVDGCRRGWVVALVPALVDEAPGRDRPTVLVVPRFTDVLAVAPQVIAVDMPIGLSDDGPRACDVEARRLLGPRRSSVFPPPVRSVVQAEPATYAEAAALSRAACGKSLSQQAFHLIPKIAELDALLTPRHQQWIVEASPELSFAAMGDGPLAHPKRTAGGSAARLALVQRAFPDVDIARPRGAAGHDVLDAYALAWTARRVAVGAAQGAGDGQRDGRGLCMRIMV